MNAMISRRHGKEREKRKEKRPVKSAGFADWFVGLKRSSKFAPTETRNMQFE